MDAAIINRIEWNEKWNESEAETKRPKAIDNAVDDVLDDDDDDNNTIKATKTKARNARIAHQSEEKCYNFLKL